ncbi:7936_t:CDS:2 [Paraglomus brasilianum]|uniref:dual-specificity kinase n=1 Tax=Paraglomus brasilianum TaxID=144538 RepID=A0A9N9FCT1_9GLOM|nr:7936_t:CDS:2 [Paraglomus brasilianum]
MVDNAPQVSQSITSIHKKSKQKDVPSSTTASSDSSHKHKSERHSKNRRYKQVQAEVLTTFNELQEVEKELGSAANDILARMDSLFRRREQHIQDDNIEKDDDGEIGKPGYGVDSRGRRSSVSSTSIKNRPAATPSTPVKPRMTRRTSVQDSNTPNGINTNGSIGSTTSNNDPLSMFRRKTTTGTTSEFPSLANIKPHKYLPDISGIGLALTSDIKASTSDKKSLKSTRSEEKLQQQKDSVKKKEKKRMTIDTSMSSKTSKNPNTPSSEEFNRRRSAYETTAAKTKSNGLKKSTTNGSSVYFDDDSRKNQTPSPAIPAPIRSKTMPIKPADNNALTKLQLPLSRNHSASGLVPTKKGVELSSKENEFTVGSAPTSISRRRQSSVSSSNTAPSTSASGSQKPTSRSTTPNIVNHRLSHPPPLQIPTQPPPVPVVPPPSMLPQPRSRSRGVGRANEDIPPVPPVPTGLTIEKKYGSTDVKSSGVSRREKAASTDGHRRRPRGQTMPGKTEHPKLDESLVFPPYNPPSLPPLDRIRQHQNTPNQSEARLKIPSTPTSAVTTGFPSKIPTPTGIVARSSKSTNVTLPSPSGSKHSRNRRPSGSTLQSGGKSTQVTTAVSTSGKPSVTGITNVSSSKKPRRNSNAATATTKVQPSLSSTSLPDLQKGGQNLKQDPLCSDAKPKLREKRDKESHAKGTTPMSPQTALKTFGPYLSQYERTEIVEYPNVYFTAPNAPKKPASTELTGCNFGFDDERGDYLVVMGDHLYYRYEIVDSLGKGSFGQVLKCLDHKTGEHVAVKIIRNKKRFHCQALVEVKILESLSRWDPEDNHNIIHMTDHFYFRNHLCIAFELLSVNLYEFIKSNNFQGFSPGLIKRFCTQLLNSLSLLQRHNIVHCDLKPENVLLKHPTKSSIKVIDFGSSCFENEKVYTYIQSRFYRSPEVILGITYNMAIDMWSLGCILAELYTGYPLFPGENEQEQLACIMEVQGLPDKYLIDKSTRKRIFFDSNGGPRPVVNSKGKRRRPGSKTLTQALKCNDEVFLDFISRCLQWDPEKRMKPDEGLMHEWITDVKINTKNYLSNYDAIRRKSSHKEENHSSRRTTTSSSTRSLVSSYTSSYSSSKNGTSASTYLGSTFSRKSLEGSTSAGGLRTKVNGLSTGLTGKYVPLSSSARSDVA